jgi:hypothetical protein
VRPRSKLDEAVRARAFANGRRRVHVHNCTGRRRARFRRVARGVRTAGCKGRSGRAGLRRRARWRYRGCWRAARAEERPQVVHVCARDDLVADATEEERGDRFGEGRDLCVGEGRELGCAEGTERADSGPGVEDTEGGDTQKKAGGCMRAERARAAPSVP